MAQGESSFIELDETESTNNYAMARIHAGLATHGDAVFTSRQTAGRGQWGRPWLASANENIALTVILSPKHFVATHQFPLSVAISLAFYDFFSSHAGEDTRIKWPNDLFWRDRKAGGILIENVVKGRSWNYAIVGLGVNINQTVFDSRLDSVVSLKQITGKTYALRNLAEQLYRQVLNRFDAMAMGAFTPMLEEYHRCLYAKDETVYLQQGEKTAPVVVRGVSEKGWLQAEETNGRLREFEYGTVQWMKR